MNNKPFEINEETLKNGNLLDKKIKEAVKSYLSGYDAFLILILSNFDKVFGYFIPSNFDFGEDVKIFIDN